MMSDNNYTQDNEDTIFHDFRSDNDSAPSPDIFFVVQEQGADAKRYLLKDNQPLTVGRGSDQDVVIGDSMVSREHIVILRTGFRVRIEIRGQNGLKMDGQLHMGKTINCESQPFQIGETVCRIESDATVLMSEEDMVSGVKSPGGLFSEQRPFGEEKRAPENDVDVYPDHGKSGGRIQSSLPLEDYDIHDVHSRSFKNDFGPEVIDQGAIKKSSPFLFASPKIVWKIMGGLIAVFFLVFIFWSLLRPLETSRQYRNGRRVDPSASDVFQPDAEETIYARYVINRAKEYMASNELDKAREVLKTVSDHHPEAILLLKEINLLSENK